jgi:hypothetical protein
MKNQIWLVLSSRYDKDATIQPGDEVESGLARLVQYKNPLSRG